MAQSLPVRFAGYPGQTLIAKRRWRQVIEHLAFHGHIDGGPVYPNRPDGQKPAFCLLRRLEHQFGLEPFHFLPRRLKTFTKGSKVKVQPCPCCPGTCSSVDFFALLQDLLIDLFGNRVVTHVVEGKTFEQQAWSTIQNGQGQQCAGAVFLAGGKTEEIE